MTRFLIDTDTAGDDVTSMLFALRWPGVTLEAVTVVAGNVYLEQAVTNALLTVEAAGRSEVPVFAGCGEPLQRSLVTAHYVHGADGMGESNFPAPSTQPQEGHGADAIVEFANRYAGDLEIIAQGPLTNVARALSLDPELGHKVARLWVMGGANNSLGNITPAAEFNFYVDPEAARMVLKGGFDTVMVPWDVCVKDGVLSGKELAPVTSLDSPLSRFYLDVNRSAWAFMRDHPKGPGVDGVSHPDSLMMAMAIDPSVIKASGRYFVDVECVGELTRGYSSVDVMGFTDQTPNAEVVLRADKDRFLEMLIQVLADPHESSAN